MSKLFWRHRNVFVTGATGLLGSWITNFLVAHGANVTILIRDHVPYSNLFSSKVAKKVNMVRGVVEDYYTLERILNEYEIDTVFHLAAQTIAPIANTNPLSTFETNIKGTWTVLEACRRTPYVTKIIVSSSDKAYGESKILPYDESTPLKGQYPYDVSKSCADLIAQTYYKTYGLPVCITRCGNLFGGGDLNFNRLVPSVIRAALFQQTPILRSNGNYIRDFLYVEDAVGGITRLAESMENLKLFGQAFNFSNETPITVIEIVQRILKRMKSSLKPEIINKSVNEIEKQYLSSKKAQKVLSWKPRFSLDDGIGKTVMWYKAFFKARERRVSDK